MERQEEGLVNWKTEQKRLLNQNNSEKNILEKTMVP